jgi:hypothetical protein
MAVVKDQSRVVILGACRSTLRQRLCEFTNAATVGDSVWFRNVPQRGLPERSTEEIRFSRSHAATKALSLRQKPRWPHVSRCRASERLVLKNSYGSLRRDFRGTLRGPLIATIREAHDLGWRLTVYCRFGKRDGMKSIRECTSRVELDLATLVWTRGRDFPIARLDSRMKCPRCGSPRVMVAFEPPPAEGRARAAWPDPRQANQKRQRRRSQPCASSSGRRHGCGSNPKRASPRGCCPHLRGRIMS